MNKKKAQALVFKPNFDTIRKTPEYVFIRFYLIVNGVYAKSKYSTKVKCLRSAVCYDEQTSTLTIADDPQATEDLNLHQQLIRAKYLELLTQKPDASANDLFAYLSKKKPKTQHQLLAGQKSHCQSLKLSTVLEVLEWYENHKRPQGLTHVRNTYETNLNFWHKYLKNNNLIKLKVGNLPPTFLNDFYEKQANTYKHNYLNGLCIFFRSAFTAATDKQLIPVVHLQKSDKGGMEATRLDEYLTEQDYEKLKNLVFEGTPFHRRIMTEARDIYVFMCETGFSYIDYYTCDYAKHTKPHKGEVLFIKKRHKVRRIKNDIRVSQRGLLTETAKNILATYNNQLPKLTYHVLRDRLKTITALLKLPLDLGRTHSARHSAGMFLLEEGASTHIVQCVLGHASLTTTETTYAVAGAEQIAEAMMKVKKK